MTVEKRFSAQPVHNQAVGHVCEFQDKTIANEYVHLLPVVVPFLPDVGF